MENNPSKPMNPLVAIGVCIALFAAVKFSGCFDTRRTAYTPSESSATTSSAERPSEESLAQAAMEKVKVKDYDFTKDGDYLYIRGSVINKSSRKVGYWKVTVNFMDKKGNIIDSGFTNALETLLPGASKRFEIMHAVLPGIDTARCYVEDVQLKD